MANMQNKTKVITGVNSRFSHFHGWEPISINGGAEKYSVSVLIPKDDKETINAIHAAVDAAIEEGIAKFGGKKPNKAAIKLPLRDGDVERDDEAYKGHYFINANSKTAPQIVDKSVKPILDRSEVYSGCYGRVSLNFYAFNSNGNKGVACGLGNIQKIRDGKKYGSNKIKILRETVGDELNELLGKTNGNVGCYNTGSHNTGSHNTGSHNTGSHNSGSYNSGSFDSGHFNSGGFNSGSYNSGWYNTGWYNSGRYNSGRYNTGWYNSGIFNKCDRNNGVFCTVEPTIKIFDIDTDITLNEFYRSKWYKAICSSDFCLTRVEGDELKTISYYDACKMWWDNMTDENKQIIQTIPNFNKGKFYEITGIKIQEG